MKLEVFDLSKRYGRINALDRVSFQIEGAGITGFIGANGAGKTTTLRIMCGIEEPDLGDVLWDGMSLVDYPEKMRRKIGFMPDSLPDANDITVKEYISFFVNSFAVRGQRRQVMDEVVGFTGIGTFLNRTLAGLSKGMKQRVSLARLLVHDPELLLLDEPAAGLDPIGRIELYNMLKSLAAKGKMIFLSSHILAELDGMVNNAVIIDRGHILRCGPVDAKVETVPEFERVSITVAGELPDAVLNMFRERAGIENIYRNGAALECIIRTEAFPQLLHVIADCNIPLISLRRLDRAAGLEQIYLNATQRGESNL